MSKRTSHLLRDTEDPMTALCGELLPDDLNYYISEYGHSFFFISTYLNHSFDHSTYEVCPECGAALTPLDYLINTEL